MIEGSDKDTDISLIDNFLTLTFRKWFHRQLLKGSLLLFLPYLVVTGFFLLLVSPLPDNSILFIYKEFNNYGYVNNFVRWSVINGDYPILLAYFLAYFGISTLFLLKVVNYYPIDPKNSFISAKSYWYWDINRKNYQYKEGNLVKLVISVIIAFVLYLSGITLLTMTTLYSVDNYISTILFFFFFVLIICIMIFFYTVSFFVPGGGRVIHPDLYDHLKKYLTVWESNKWDEWKLRQVFKMGYQLVYKTDPPPNRKIRKLLINNKLTSIASIIGYFGFNTFEEFYVSYIDKIRLGQISSKIKSSEITKDLVNLVKGSSLGVFLVSMVLAIEKLPKKHILRKKTVTILQQLDHYDENLKTFLKLQKDLGRRPTATECFDVGISISELPITLELANLGFTEMIDWDKLQPEYIKDLEDKCASVAVKNAIHNPTLSTLVFKGELGFFQAKIVQSYLSYILSLSDKKIKRLSMKCGYDKEYSMEPGGKGDQLAVRLVLLMLEEKKAHKKITHLNVIDGLKIGPLVSRYLWLNVEIPLSWKLPSIEDLDDHTSKIIDDNVRKLLDHAKKGILPSNKPLTLEEVISYLSSLSSLYHIRLTVKAYNEVLMRKPLSVKPQLTIEQKKVTFPREILKLTPVKQISQSFYSDTWELLKQGGSFPLDKLLEELNIIKDDQLQEGFLLKEQLSIKYPHENWWVIIDKQKSVRLQKAAISCQICQSEVFITNNKPLFAKCLNCGKAVCGDHYLDLETVSMTNCPYCGGYLELYPVQCEGCGFDIVSPSQKADNKHSCHYCGYSLPSNDALLVTLHQKHSGTKGLKIDNSLIDDKKAKYR